jgi:predicted transcriptional regulator
MSEQPDHDVQALSDVDFHVYEAIAAEVVEHGPAGLGALVRATGLEEDDVRASLRTLMDHGHVLPVGEGYGLGEHTFEVEY